MGFGNILYGSLRGSTARARLFLYGIPFVGVGLAVLGIFEPFEGARWNPEKIRRSLTQKTLLETVAQRALAFSDRALRAARPDRPENELLAKFGPITWGHLFDIFAPFSFERRGIGFHLREPIAEARQAGGDKEHESTDLKKNPDAFEVHRHHEAGGGEHHERNGQESRLAWSARAFVVKIHRVIRDCDEEHTIAKKADQGLKYQFTPVGVILATELEIEQKSNNDQTARPAEGKRPAHELRRPGIREHEK